MSGTNQAPEARPALVQNSIGLVVKCLTTSQRIAPCLHAADAIGREFHECPDCLRRSGLGTDNLDLAGWEKIVFARLTAWRAVELCLAAECSVTPTPDGQSILDVQMRPTHRQGVLVVSWERRNSQHHVERRLWVSSVLWGDGFISSDGFREVNNRTRGVRDTALFHRLRQRIESN